MPVHDASAPADPKALTRMLNKLAGRDVIHFRKLDVTAGPYYLVPVLDEGNRVPVRAALKAYPGVVMPSLHAHDPDVHLGRLTVHAVPRHVYSILSIYRERPWSGSSIGPTLDDFTTSEAYEHAPTVADFADMLVRQLSHPVRPGSDALAAATRQAVDILGFEAARQLLLAMPPVPLDLEFAGGTWVARTGALARAAAAVAAATAPVTA